MAPKIIPEGILPANLPLGALVSILHRTHMIYLDRRLGRLELSAGQFPLLVHLARTPGITQDDLAAYFRIDKGTVARAMKKLEDNGFVYRSIDPENRRRYCLCLTKKGEIVMPQALRIANEWEEAICAGSSETDLPQVYDSLRTLVDKSLELAQSSDAEGHGTE
jgi:DNA-binding MarR family transcriptional regulator